MKKKIQDFDLHMHTTYCDGKSSAEDMVLAAIEKGLAAVGISGHSFTPHDTSYCMSRENTLRYIDEINSLKLKYQDSIRVLLGIELDYYADTDLSPYDYTIGSVHYLFNDPKDAEREGIVKFYDWVDVDSDPGDLKLFANNNATGLDHAARLYYRTAADIVRKTNCDIIGHFDLITKFNELRQEDVPSVCRIDTADPDYIKAWKDAADSIFEDCRDRYKKGFRNRLETLGLLEVGDRPVFEINTGAISRGYRTSPYPASDQIEYIRDSGGLLILSSDSHSASTICWAFEEYE